MCEEKDGKADETKKNEADDTKKDTEEEANEAEDEEEKARALETANVMIKLFGGQHTANANGNAE